MDLNCREMGIDFDDNREAADHKFAIEQNLPRRVVRYVKDGRLLTRRLNSKQEKQRLLMVSLDVGY